jgi:hypothetical protein
MQCNKISVANFKHECAHVRRIHVSFGCNQQLAHCRVTIRSSEVQSGGLVTRTENQKQIRGISNKKYNTKSGTCFEHEWHPFIAFESALAAISSWQASVLPSQAARCRAVLLALEQKIRSRFQKQNTPQDE